MKSDPQRTTWPELAAILLIRLGFLWTLVLIALLIPGDQTALYALMGVAFIITIPYSLWLRNRVRTMQFAPLQFIVDLVMVSGVVYFTGGIYSNLTLLYPLVILCAGIVNPPRRAAQITGLGLLTYALMATLIRNGVLVEYLPAEQALQLNRPESAVLLRLLIFLCFGGVSIYISKRCQYIDRHAGQAAQAVQSLINGLATPTLLLDPEGRVLEASQSAADLLHMEPSDLYGMSLSDLCTAGDRPIPAHYGRTSFFKRAGQPPLPVEIKTNTVRFPQDVFPTVQSLPDGTAQVSLINLNDITKALETEQRLEKIEQVCAATRITGELAHEIRTPLTALSASIELLRHLEKKMTPADWLPDSPRKSERRELFDHIEEASQQMSAVIKDFVDFADYSPEDLLSIIKLDSDAHNQGYIGHSKMTGRGYKNGQDSHSGR